MIQCSLCSVFDIDDETIPTELRNGYTFLTADEQVPQQKTNLSEHYLVIRTFTLDNSYLFWQGLNNALERAFSHYLNNPASWQQLVQKVMNVDFSWETSAAQYEELYSKSVARARAVAAGRAQGN